MKFCLLMLCFLLAGCRGDAVAWELASASDEVPIYVASHGWHTGIIVEKKAVLTAIPELKQAFQAARFIEFGWGDQDFYQASDIAYGLAIKALFLPTEAVLHVAGIPKSPQLYFRSSEVEEIMIPEAGFNKMLAFFQKSFKRDSRGNFVPLGRGLYADSIFFGAHGSYHVFYTCNSWIMEALTEAGLPKPGLPTLTAEGVMDQVKRYKYSARPNGAESPVDMKR